MNRLVGIIYYNLFPFLQGPGVSLGSAWVGSGAILMVFSGGRFCVWRPIPPSFWSPRLYPSLVLFNKTLLIL